MDGPYPPAAREYKSQDSDEQAFCGRQDGRTSERPVSPLGRFHFEEEVHGRERSARVLASNLVLS
jgi:hypothetical protein